MKSTTRLHAALVAFLAVLPTALAAPISGDLEPATSPNPAQVLKRNGYFTCSNGYTDICNSTYEYYCNQYGQVSNVGTGAAGNMYCLSNCYCAGVAPICKRHVCGAGEFKVDDDEEETGGAEAGGEETRSVDAVAQS